MLQALLPHTMSIFATFLACWPLRKRASLKSSKSHQTRDPFTAISDLKNNEERALLQAGNRQLSQKFQEKVFRYLIIGNKHST